MLPRRVRVNPGAIAMNGYPVFPKVPALLEPHHQIVQCHIKDTRWGDLTPLQRSSGCILQHHPSEHVPVGDLIFLFNGLSTFKGYLMPKLIL